MSTKNSSRIHTSKITSRHVHSKMLKIKFKEKNLYFQREKHIAFEGNQKKPEDNNIKFQNTEKT